MIEFYALYNGKTFVDDCFKETADILNAVRYDELSAYKALKYIDAELEGFNSYDIVKIKMTIEMEDV